MHRILLTILAAEPAQDGGGIDVFVMIGMIFLIFWFLVIRPGSKERKAREKDVKALKKHDKVVTNAGIHGTVMILEDENVILRVDDKNNVRMKFSRAAIWQVLSDETPDDGKGKGNEKGKGKTAAAGGAESKDTPKDSKSNDSKSNDSKSKGSKSKAYQSKAKSADTDAPAETTAS